MWAPLGNNWYDSLQMKGDQELLARPGLHGGIHVVERTGHRTGRQRCVQPRRIRSRSPAVRSRSCSSLGFNYETPEVHGEQDHSERGGRLDAGRDCCATPAALPIGVPGSQSNLNALVFQSTRMNRVPGEPLFLKDLNCHCIDPNKDFVLNPKAWADVPQGQWGSSAPYYNDYRQARVPSEQLSFGRIFRMKESYRLQLRAEFFNVFNRIVMPTPSSGNPLQTPTRNSAGVPTAGFGRIDASTVSGQRNGQIVARVEW